MSTPFSPLHLAAIGLSALTFACEDSVGPGDTLPPGVEFSAWSPAVRVETITGTHPSFNTSSLDGCPLQSRDGKTFFMASDRPGGLGGIDIWVATRASENDPWGEPTNLGAPINSTYNDFCPTSAGDPDEFFFVSERPTWSGGAACGGADIYTTRFLANGSAEDPRNLGCAASGGPNSAAGEASPYPLSLSGADPVLYFSSARAGGLTAEAAGAVVGDQDLYLSRREGDVYGPAELVAGANSASDDAQPNVRSDGLELYFFSTRPGTFGGPDIYSSTRANISDAWSEAVNAGANVNSASPDSRPSLSWDATTLYFGSARPGGEGSTDIYISTRERL